MKRKRGAPPGNRNAVKHGFYSHEFNKAEQYDFLLAIGMEGITEEIALLRFEIKKALTGGDVKNLFPLTKAAESLEKLVRTQYRLYLGKREELKLAVENVVRAVLLPLYPSIASAPGLLELVKHGKN
jgi:hypothetical protein